MNFSTADKVSSVINQMKVTEVTRGNSRALIDTLFNGMPPYSAQEEKENNIFVNVNFKEGTNALHAARGQYENAFLKSGNFFKITVDDVPVEKQAEWSNIITKELNGVLKKSRPYIHAQRNKFAGVVLHGVGAEMWPDDEDPIPYDVAMQDILIPTGTNVSLDNLQFFAVRRRMKPGTLFKKTFGAGDLADPGWQKDVVKKVLDSLKDVNLQPDQTMNWSNQPEQMQELYKQNTGYYDSDKAPEIVAWDFYHLEEGDGGKQRGWYREIILDSDCTAAPSTATENPTKFLYTKNEPVAEDIDHIISFQFGDGNNVPPFKYHSIRSLGWLLFDVIQLTNRLRCQFTQHVFEQMLTLFRVNDSTDRARVSKVLLFDKGIIPDGVNIVPAAERFTVDAALVGNLMANMRQLVNESSASYTQQIDNGTQKERTKFEVEAIMSQISSLMSSMLNLAYIQEFFAYQEICRRFANKTSKNFTVKKFRSACIEQGVPETALDSRKWTIAVEQVLGSGNKMLEIAQARELRNMRPTLDPEAQREVDRIYIGALTDNAKLADFLVPKAPQVTDAIHDAELAFGSLMLGAPLSVKEGLNHHEQITTLLKLMGMKIKAMQAADGVGTPQEVSGLANVSSYIQKQIAILSQDPDERSQVKEYNDTLGNFMNFVRAFAQRQRQEAQKKAQAEQQAQMQPAKRPSETLNYKDAPPDVQRQIEAQAGLQPSTIGGVDPASLAKINAENARLQMEAQKHAQSMTLDQAEFEAEQNRKNEAAASEIARKNLQATANINSSTDPENVPAS